MGRFGDCMLKPYVTHRPVISHLQLITFFTTFLKIKFLSMFCLFYMSSKHDKISLHVVHFSSKDSKFIYTLQTISLLTNIKNAPSYKIIFKAKVSYTFQSFQSHISMLVHLYIVTKMFNQFVIHYYTCSFSVSYFSKSLYVLAITFSSLVYNSISN